MRELKQFVSASARRKGAAECLLCRPASDSGCKFFSVLASFVLAEQRQALQLRAQCEVSCPPLWIPRVPLLFGHPSFPLRCQLAPYPPGDFEPERLRPRG